MALHQKPKGGEIIRTPAPDADPRVQNYGASSLVPGKGGPLTALGRNLEDSIDDPARDKILAQGTAGRGDEISADLSELKSFDASDLPADGSLQRRTVSDTAYPSTHGAVRQQDPQKAFGNVTDRPQRISDRLSANGVRALNHEAQPVRKPK
jgi:hypothetical protein